MSIGSKFLKLRLRYGHGLRVAYRRDYVRPRILHSPPIRTQTAGAVEVHVLTSHDDLLNLFWALKSFYHFAGRSYTLVVHEDGSFAASDFHLLRQHFPDARVLSRREREPAVRQSLQRLPRCARFRDLHPLAQKAFDVGLFAQAERVLLLDSDVLFFSYPAELVRQAETAGQLSNVFNRDVAPALNISVSEARGLFNIGLVPDINSGLAVLQRDVFNLGWMEEFLGAEALWSGHPWRIEQTLIALAACRLGAQLLGPEYRVTLGRGLAGCVAKHYVGEVRHLMYREGIGRLMAERFLEQLGQGRASGIAAREGAAAG